MDLERGKALQSSLMWAGVSEEMDMFIYYETQKLKTCTAEELPTIQAKIAVYESVKNLPQTIIEREEL